MGRIVSAGTAGLLFFVSSCAIRPIPDESTGRDTVAIVRGIRCEAREAVKNKLIAWLEARLESETAVEQAASMRVAADIRAEKEAKEISNDGLDEATVYYINRFSQAAIAFAFTFDMTQDLTNSATISILDTFKNGTSTYGMGAGLVRSRNNKRALAIGDKFGALYTDYDSEYCAIRNDDPNYIYPVIGNIGMKEMIDTFVDLSVFDFLKKNQNGEDGPQVMTDTVEFTTKLSGNINPTIVLAPVTNGVTNFGFVNSASRTDKHSVVIGLSLPVEDKTVKNFVGEFLIGRGDGTLRQAFEAVDQVKRENAERRVRID